MTQTGTGRLGLHRTRSGLTRYGTTAFEDQSHSAGSLSMAYVHESFHDLKAGEGNVQPTLAIAMAG
jgi:hypothetical protein